MPDQDEIAKFLAQDAESLVDQHARKYGVDPSFAKRILKKESALRPDVLTGGRRSRAGAIGPMQLMPGTAKELGVDPSNYEQNIEGGVKYLAQMQKQFGDPAKAAAAYNAGPGAVQKYGGVPPYAETQDYVRSVSGGDDIAEFLANDAQSAPITPAKPLTRPAKPGPIRNPQRGPIAPTANPFATNQGATGFQEQAQKAYERTQGLSQGRPQGLAEAANQFKQAALKGFARIPQGISESLQMPVGDSERRLAQTLGPSATEDIKRREGGLRRTISQATEPVVKKIEQAYPVDPNDQSWLTQKIPAGAGGLVPMIASSILGRGLGAKSSATSALSGAAQSAGEVSDRLNKAGIEGPQRNRSAALATATGATEALGLGRALDKIGAKRAIMGRLGNVAEDVAQEYGQEYLGDVNAKLVGQYDKNASLSPISPNKLEAAALGGILGGAMQGAGALASKRPGAPLAVPPVQPEPQQPLTRVDPLGVDARGKITGGRTPIQGTPRVVGTPQPSGPAQYSTRPNTQQTQITPIPTGQEYAKLTAKPEAAPTTDATAQTIPAGNLAGIRVIAEGERIPASQRRNVKTIVVKQPDGSMQSVRAMLPEGMTPGQARQVLQGAQKAQAKAAVNPRQAARNENIQKAHEDSIAARTQAEAAMRDGRHDEAIRALTVEAEALRALRKQIPDRSRGGRVRRVEAGERLTQIQQEMKAAKIAQRQAVKAENAPTADLTGPLVPDAPQTARMPETPNRTTAGIPRSMQRTTAEIPRPVDAPLTEPTNRLRNADYPGGEIPRAAGLRPEGQPVEIPAERVQENTNRLPGAEYAGGEVRTYQQPQAEGQPVDMSRRPPAPPRPAGGRAVRRGPQGQYGPTTMSAAFPRSRRGLVVEGRRVQGEIEAGRGDKGEYGKLAQSMFKSTRGDVLHGQDSFFHDADVKGALGLTRDAEQGEVRAALKTELARVMGVKSEEVSLTQVPPQAWQNWAGMKQLGEGARAKLQVAIQKYQSPILDELQKTTNPPDSSPPRPVPTDRGSTPKAPSDFQRLRDANAKAIAALNSVSAADAATPGGKRKFDAAADRLRKSAKQMGIDPSHADAIITDAMNAQMEAARRADAAPRPAVATMTADAFLADELVRSRYKDSIQGNENARQSFESRTLATWKDAVERAGEADRLPDAVLDSYANRFGADALRRVFRGTREQGAEGWMPRDQRDILAAEQEAEARRDSERAKVKLETEKGIRKAEREEQRKIKSAAKDATTARKEAARRADEAPRPVEATPAQEAPQDAARFADGDRVDIAGAQFDVVRANADGTVTLRNDQGDTWQEDPSASWRKVNAPAKKATTSEAPEMSKRSAYIEARQREQLETARSGLTKARQAIQEHLQKTGVKLPMGISAEQYVNARVGESKRPNKDLTALKRQLDAAQESVARAERELADTKGGIGSTRYTHGEVHRRMVESAIAKGKPVPAEVLADYPDLAPKAPAPKAHEAPPAAPPWPKMTREQSAAWESDIAGGKPANARRAEAPPVAETRPRAVSEAEAAPIAAGDAGKAAPNQVARKIHQIVEDEATGTKQHGYQAESGFYDRYESLDMPERQVLLKELVRLGSLPKGWDRKKNPSPGEILREMRSTAQRKAQQAQYEARTRIPDGAFPVAVPPAPKAERAAKAKPEGSTVEKGDVVMWQGKPHKVTVGVDYIGLSEILTDRGDTGQNSRGWKTSESFEKDTGYKATFLDPKIERTKAKAEARKYSPRSTHRNAKEWVDDHVSKGFTEVERYAAPGQKTIFNLRNPETNESFTIAGVEREYAEAVAKNLTDYDASTGARVPRKGVADASAARIAKAKPAPEAAPPAAQPETPRGPGATVERGLPDVAGLREHYLREAAQHNAEADKLADEDAKAHAKKISGHRHLAEIAERKAARIDEGAHSLIKPTAEEDAAVTAASRKQKEIPRVGLTPAQADYLRGKVAEVKPALEADDSRAITIRVPDDGQFTVRTPEQADKLIERLKSPIVSEYKPPRPTNPRENAKMPGDIGESTKTAPTYNDQVEGAYPLEKVTPGGWNGNATTHKGWVTDGHTAMRTDKMTPAKKASLGKLGKLGGRLSPEKFDAFVDDMAKRLTGPRSQGAQIEDLVAVGGKLGQGGQVAIAKTDNGEIISLDARQLANIIESVDFDTVRAQTGSDAISGSIGFFKGDKLQALAMPLKQDEGEVPRAQNLIAEARKPRVKGSVGKLDREESGGPVVGSGFGALQGAFKSKPPTGADLDAWMDRMGNAIPETMTDAQISRFDDLVNRAADAAEAGNAREWKRLSRQAEQMIFTRKDRAIAEVSGAMNATRSLMASGDLSAPLRQGAILTLPPSQWGKAGRAAKRMFQALSAGKYERLKQEIQVHPDFDAAEEAGLYLATNDSGRTRGEEDFLRNNSLASRIVERMPVLAHSERAYKMYLDSLRMDTFAKYKHVIEKGGGTDEQKAKALKAAAEWINVATGRGSLGKSFDKAAPWLSTITFAPRYTASRIQMLNPATYAKNLGDPASRQVFRRQMSEMFQSAAVLTTMAALAKYGLGATVNLDDPDSPDWLKIKIGDTRYDVSAGMQQIARLGARIGKYLDTSVRGTEAQQAAESPKLIKGMKTFGRTRLAPVPSFFMDWADNWRNVIGEYHPPSEVSVKNPVVSRVMPLLWADMVDAYREGGAGKAARFTPGVFGVGVQDYDVNKKRKAETKARVRPKTPPMPGPPKGFGEL